MYSVIAADAKTIAITGYDPYAKLGTCSFKATGYCSCAAMNAVHAIGIHVIRKPAAATDTAYNHNILSGNTERGHYFLHLCKNGIIAAAGAPAYFLICREIFGGKSRFVNSNCIGHDVD